MAERMNGSCLCGAVRFTAVPERPKFNVCHCGMCRRWTGGPFFGVHCGTDVRFENEDQVGVIQTSEWAERGFCTSCGSALFYRLREAGTYEIAMGTLDGAEAFDFGLQVFVDKKPENYAFANETRMMTEQQVIDYFVKSNTGEADAT